MSQEITLTVDDHDRACVVRRYEHATRRAQLFTEVLTTKDDLLRIVDPARRDAGRGGVTWIQESTTGWARVQELLGTRAAFHLANVLQMPLPPKARRRKTDKVDLRDLVDVGRRHRRGQRHALASVITWCLLPDRPRSVGFGPVSSPPSAACGPGSGTGVGAGAAAAARAAPPAHR